jgi:hypothetical protein
MTPHPSIGVTARATTASDDDVGLLRRAAAPVGFGVAVVILVIAGRGVLATPPMHGFGDWLDAHGAAVAAMAIVRLAALGAAAWMFVFSTVVVVARAVGAVALADLVESAVPPSVRRALAIAAGLGAVTVPAAGLLGDGPATTPDAVQLVDAVPRSTVTMSLLEAAPTPVAAPVVDDDAWTVSAGDSFWSIADEVLGEHLGRPPTDVEVAPYWRTLIDANRDNLLTADPNLLVPGQVLTVPAPGA